MGNTRRNEHIRAHMDEGLRAMGKLLRLGSLDDATRLRPFLLLTKRDLVSGPRPPIAKRRRSLLALQVATGRLHARRHARRQPMKQARARPDNIRLHALPAAATPALRDHPLSQPTSLRLCRLPHQRLGHPSSARQRPAHPILGWCARLEAPASQGYDFENDTHRHLSNL